MPKWSGGRTIGELLTLLIGVTLCGVVMLTAAGLFVLAVIQPNRDTTAVGNALGDLINTMIGLMAGFLAGRQDMVNRQRATPGQTDDAVTTTKPDD